jgi:hypothetical protein
MWKRYDHDVHIQTHHLTESLTAVHARDIRRLLVIVGVWLDLAMRGIATVCRACGVDIMPDKQVTFGVRVMMRNHDEI